jgi:hypothetical protein
MDARRWMPVGALLLAPLAALCALALAPAPAAIEAAQPLCARDGEDRARDGAIGNEGDELALAARVATRSAHRCEEALEPFDPDCAMGLRAGLTNAGSSASRTAGTTSSRRQAGVGSRGEASRELGHVARFRVFPRNGPPGVPLVSRRLATAVARQRATHPVSPLQPHSSTCIYAPHRRRSNGASCHRPRSPCSQA